MKKLFPFVLTASIALAVEALAQVSKPSLILQPPTPAAGDGFGTAVVAFGNDVLVGAPGDDSLAADAGAVYLFEGATGKLLRAFTNPSADAGDNFGSAIAVFGSTIVIGAPGEGSEVTDIGAAYLFDGNTGTLLDALLNPSPVEGDRFGSSIAISGNTIIVGTPFVDDRSPDGGAVYLFDLNTRQLQREILLLEDDDFARFGTSVAAVGNGFVVGTPSDGDTRIASFGSVYFYDDISDQQPLYIPNPLFQSSTNLQDSLRADNNGFGQSVAAFGNNLLAGAPFNP
ncbi:MAG: FG-GAP repeat protein, partial [bacterium]